jgi:hypothetical protein
MSKIKQKLLGLYFSVINSWPIWYGIRNRDARRKFLAAKPKLSAVQEQIVNTLKRDGIAFITLDEFFPGENMLQKLQADMENRTHVADKLRKKTARDSRDRTFVRQYVA